MKPEFYGQIKLLRWLAVVTLFSLVIQFFGGITLINFNPPMLDAALQGETERLFATHAPASRPFQSLLIMAVMSGFFIPLLFSHVRVALFVPIQEVIFRHSMFVLHFCMAAIFCLMVTKAHYAEFFAPDGIIFEGDMGQVAVSIYLFVFFAGVEHLFIGLWSIKRRSMPRYVGWGSFITASFGVLLNLAALNTTLHPGRMVFGAIFTIIDIAIWMVFVWSIQPPGVPADDAVPTMTAPAA